MTKNFSPVKPDVLDCKLCLAEVPHSVVNSLEGGDYIFHYFGAACYQLWQAQYETDLGKVDVRFADYRDW